MHRRTLLSIMTAAPLSALPSMAGAWGKRPSVDLIEIVRLRVNKRGNWIIARLNAGDLTGLGDASHGGHDEETIGALQRFAALLRGRSIFDVEWFWRRHGRKPALTRRHRPMSLSAHWNNACGI